ncbi:nickel pincer cofactor biosynthesis protein LarB [Limisalsivibrio acetivorans]|uniref:nickel pincer cofactor biosynthesis protein LarB n=1 Tax=Limisalsivibrio acetivorans TaxID=1304888 RepID=UPI0003B46277|nr:nickel pincer cofactor biosynthesis protein LarB [Limisalsivibrio acetivorans]
MNRDELLELLEAVSKGELKPDDAAGKLSMSWDGFNGDMGRGLRLGFDEVIFGRGKTKEQIEQIAGEYLSNELNFFCTGLDDQKYAYLSGIYPQFEYNPLAGTMRYMKKEPVKLNGTAAVITAGTSDMKVALEAAETLEILGIEHEIYSDIGVAGLHRFVNRAEQIRAKDVIIVVAGMEGALPSVVGGSFPQPVIAVPSSVGYGVSKGGFTALLGMLSSCAPGVTVVNIDNGYGAAVAAFRILNGR